MTLQFSFATPFVACYSNHHAFFSSLGIAPAGTISASDDLAQSLGFTPFGSEKTDSRSGGNLGGINGGKPGTAPSTKNGVSNGRDSLLEVVADYDGFLTLMEVVDAARKRKLELLGLLEDANALMVNRLPFGDGARDSPELSRGAKEHLAWLRSNLEQTNQVLRSASDYLRLLFGDSYLPTQPTQPSNDRDMSLQLLQSALAARSNQTSQLSRDWAAKLVAHTDDVSGTLAWSVGQPVTKKQKNMPRDIVHIDGLWIDIKHRVAAAGQLACTASYIRNTAASGGPAGPDSAIALDVAHEKLIHSFEFPQAGGGDTRNHLLYNEVLDARESAKEDLVDALNLLKTELELSNLKPTAVSGGLEL